MTTPQSARTWLLALLTLVGIIALLSGCGDTAAQECAGFPNTELKPACEEAAAQCDTTDNDLKQMCIDEALALCA
jgi:hypothetical protein